VKRGDIWLVNDGVALSEDVRAERLCLVVSPDVLLERLDAVLVVPVLRGGRPVSFRPTLRFRETEGVLVCDQLQALPKSHFVRRQGAADRKTLAAALAVVRELFAD